MCRCVRMSSKIHTKPRGRNKKKVLARSSQVRSICDQKKKSVKLKSQTAVIAIYQSGHQVCGVDGLPLI